MLALGVVYLNHDAAAALINDGKIIAASLEERFNREKHSAAFPAGAIQYCLDTAGIHLNEVDRIGFFTNPHLYHKLAMYNLWAGFPKSFLYLPYPLKLILRDYSFKKTLVQNMQLMNPPVTYVAHHLAHAASAFYVSPFESATVLTLDGRGEFETACIYTGHGTALSQQYHLKYPHSLGYLYNMVTRYLGFRPVSDEYKVMGLSAYGTPALSDEFSDVAYFDRAGNFRLNLSYFDHTYTYGKRRIGFSEKFVKKFGRPRANTEPIDQRHADIAFAVQKLTESAILRLARLAYEISKEKYLCLAGGVALNCLGMAKIMEEGPFEKIFIQPAADDSGTSLGSALYSYYTAHPEGERSQLEHVFWGPEFSNDQILATVSKYKDLLVIEYCEDVCKTAARLIHEGLVIGWFQGRMEFGPRALGNRSIIAAPVNPKMKDLINSKIKFREEFRPFAPAILEEYMDSFFEVNPAGEFVYPYMLATAKTRTEVIDRIPAVVHADSTSRLQSVTQKANPLFRRLIEEYAYLSHIPLILNTSFNIRGEPIVCSVEDAIRSLLDSGLDYAVIGNFLMKRRSEM